MKTENKHGHPRGISVNGLHNARDLGGLVRAEGGLTPFGIFFRSENLHGVTLEGWQKLHAAGIRTVIDLRQPAERHQVGYNAPEWFTVAHVDHDGLDDHPGFWGDYWETGLVGTALYYLPHLRQLPTGRRPCCPRLLGHQKAASCSTARPAATAPGLLRCSS